MLCLLRLLALAPAEAPPAAAAAALRPHWPQLHSLIQAALQQAAEEGSLNAGGTTAGAAGNSACAAGGGPPGCKQPAECEFELDGEALALAPQAAAGLLRLGDGQAGEGLGVQGLLSRLEALHP